MIRRTCAKIAQSKNLLMLLTVGIYILALFSVFSNTILPFTIIVLGSLSYFAIKDCFPLKYTIIWALVFATGIVNTSFRIKDVDQLLNYAPINTQISGKIISIPQGISENKPKFFFEVSSLKTEDSEIIFKNEKVFVTINSNKNLNFNELKLYNKLALEGRLAQPFKAGNPSQFDYGNYLKNYNTYAVFYAQNYKLLESKPNIKEHFLQSINNYRENILKLHAKYLESPNLEIIGGIVFGDDAVSPPKNIKESFVNSGLLHILAASGMNVAFIYSFFFMIMSSLKINFKVSVILGMLMVIIYSLMTGLGPSVVRATCMLLFVLIGKLIDRDAHSIALLSFVGLLMLLYNPMSINDVGFQLSFVVTFGILIMSPAFTRPENKVLDFTLSTLTIPIIAQLWVIPIQIFYFNNISLYSVFANILSIPILMILSFGGFISSLLAILTPIADFICKTFDFILNPLTTTLINISDFWGNLPNSSLQTTHPSVLQILLYYSILLIISALLYKEIREKYLIRFLKIILTLTMILLISTIPIKDSSLEIITFDVGNADSFLIKTPDNENIIIDTGKSGYKGGKSQAEIILLKYFKDKGIKNIDSIIITHFDNDHCGGAFDLIKNLNVKKLYVNDLNHNSINAQSIYDIANSKKVSTILAHNQQVVYNKNGLKITNLLGVNTDNDNENSIITLLEYQNYTLLFTGDASFKGINSVLNNIPQNITALKVPHHGALGGLNPALISYLNPKYSIISVGENKFGHPNPYTLYLLKNSTILRTDINNSIKITINKNKLRAYTYNNISRKYKLFK